MGEIYRTIAPYIGWRAGRVKIKQGADISCGGMKMVKYELKKEIMKP